MKRILKKNAILYFLLLMLLSACNQDQEKGLDPLSDSVMLELQLSCNSSNPLTKASQGDKYLRPGARLGISIFPEGEYENHKDLGIDGCKAYQPVPEYRRILALNKSLQSSLPGNYIYRPENFKEDASHIYLKKKEGVVDFYVFYPYTHVNDFRAIPFTIGHLHGSFDRDPSTETSDVNYDYMIAQDGVLKIDPNDAEGEHKNFLKTPVVLKHIMTQLEFKFDISFYGQDLLPRITIRCPDKIVTQGTYSYYDGAITASTTASSFDFTGLYIYARYEQNGKNSTQGFMIPPIEVGENDPTQFEIEVKFNAGPDPAPVQNEPYKFNLKDLMVTDSHGTARYGLLAGYKYTIKLKIDNFIKYTGTPEVQEWTQEKMEDFPI